MWAPRKIRGTRLANQYANLGLGRAKECSDALIPGLNWKPQREEKGWRVAMRESERGCLSSSVEARRLLIHSSVKMAHV